MSRDGEHSWNPVRNDETCWECEGWNEGPEVTFGMYEFIRWAAEELEKYILAVAAAA